MRQDKPIKILHLVTNGKLGGVEVFLKNLLKEWTKYNHFSHTVCFLMQKNVIGRQIENSGISACALNMRNGFDLFRAIKLIKIKRQENYQIIHCHHTYQPLVWLIIFILKPRLVVLSDHGNGLIECREKTRRILETFFHLYIKKFITRYTAVCNLSKQVLMDTYHIPKDKIEVIYNGVDTNHFNPWLFNVKKQRQKFNLPLHTPIIGLVGRLVAPKGIDHFIMAASEVIRQYPNTLFLVVGDGPLRAQLQEQVKNAGISQKLIFLGERKDIPALLSVMDIFILSSVQEALPVVAIEAMAMEKPVIAYSVGGLSELIVPGKTGVLIKKRDHKLLAQSICELLQDKGSRIKGQAARRRVFQLFDIEKISQKYLQLYSTILRKV